jgi:hypothetical protein
MGHEGPSSLAPPGLGGPRQGAGGSRDGAAGGLRARGRQLGAGEPGRTVREPRGRAGGPVLGEGPRPSTARAKGATVRRR